MARKKLAVTSSFWPSSIHFGESYSSLLLGILAVIILAIIIVLVSKGRSTQPISPTREVSSTKTVAPKEQIGELPKTYTVALGDSLWTIAEKVYKSGYNWVDIAKANKLENPDAIDVGMKLTLPKVEPKVITQVNQATLSQKTENVQVNTKQVYQTNKITGSTYNVVKGDYLWEIAVRAYGDGYRWVDIARENKLSNPNLIHSGNMFKIPR